MGPAGPSFSTVVVDGITTLNPGENATVMQALVGTELHLSLGIPRGADGANRTAGATGLQGPQGPPFAAAVVDAVNTLNPGDNATVASSFDGTNLHLTFGIPRGANGADGGTARRGRPAK